MSRPRHLTLGPVELTVSDLQRSLAFYRQLLGMTVLDHAGTTASLGVGTLTLLVLTERPGARPASVTSPGLYHFAFLLPTRADLARWVKHAAGTGVRLGQGDHLVSEAFYLSDPDGHGIEVYCDRPREQWHWDSGQVRMSSDPIDIPGLLAEAGVDAAFHGLPAGTVMGHVHLRVTNLVDTEAFYRQVLGLDVVARWPGALFVSAGGYHHHFGLNTWQSEGGEPAPESTSRLEAVRVTLPDMTELERLGERVQGARLACTSGAGSLEVRDPSGHRLIFSAT